MHVVRFAGVLLLAAMLAGCGQNTSDAGAAATVDASAAAPSPEAVEPDVPYVPTSHETVEKMLEVAGVGRTDVVYDLGSGDGRIVIAAARDRGARGVGIDIDADRVREASENVRDAGVTDRVRIVQGDLFDADLSEATVVTLYLLESVNQRLRPKLLAELRPGTRVVSHDFSMGAWEADARVTVGKDTVYYWIVPADVRGTWRWNGGGTDFALTLDQRFQNLRTVGTGRDVQLRSSRLAGDRIELELVRGGHVERYEGRIRGNVIEGTMATASGKTRWTARRV